ncbi:flagellar biosynthetic protein FliR [Halocynthiibacter namhaensis]|uniref:flagellar biosynthetic protein FliR n=1 Tax=Halocynthiibacter namhaensis TaxID=1290553 RepID=UPI0005793DE5|nr:flagellar biosynthetic protein FliR [Halocynthiibacter namhaensis]
MNELLPFIIQLGERTLGIGAIVFLRVGAAMAMLPAFGEQSVPVRVRLSLTIAFTLVVAPAIAPGFQPPPTAAMTGLGCLAEVVIGLALGFAVRFFILALQTAGSIAAQSTSLSQIFGGSGEPAPAMGHLLLFAGLALAVMSGLHIRLSQYLILSYDVLPFGQMPEAQQLSTWGLAGISRTFALAFTLSAPFLVASLIYNFALGVINRAMPQLMVTFVGAPAITAGGMLLLIAAAPILLSAWSDALSAFLMNPFVAR